MPTRPNRPNRPTRKIRPQSRTQQAVPAGKDRTKIAILGGVIAALCVVAGTLYFLNVFGENGVPEKQKSVPEKSVPADEAAGEIAFAGLDFSSQNSSSEVARDREILAKQFADDGNAEFARGNFELAEQHFVKAKQFGAKNVDFELAMSRFKNGRITAAIAEIESQAEAGNLRAQQFLAKEYFDGNELGKNDELAVKFLKLAAENGDVPAQKQLAKIYFAGTHGVEKSPAEGEKILKNLAENGDADAQMDLAQRYLYGIEMTQNDAAAARWLDELKKSSNPQAQYLLGCCYFDGRGVKKNRGKARELWSLAADGGNVEAAEKIEKFFAGTKFSKHTKTQPKHGKLAKHPTTKVPNANRYLGKYEVSQAQFRAIMGTNPSSHLRRGNDLGNYPVENVSWDEAMEFCKKLTEYEREQGFLPAGYEYSLPRKEDWYAAWRAEKSTKLSLMNYKTIAWFAENSKGETQPVGRLANNPLGFKDMLGNVAEWTLEKCIVGGDFAQYGHDHVTCVAGQIKTADEKHAHADGCFCRHGSDDVFAGTPCKFAETSRASAWKKKDVEFFEQTPAGTDFRSPRVGFRVILTNEK